MSDAVTSTLQNLTLQQGASSMEVSPVLGARICSFSLEGQDVLTGADVDPDNFGSTFWTSPQSDWEWPPPPEVDHQPYRVQRSGSSYLCVGSLSRRLGVLISKRFATLPARDGFSVQYVIHNQGPTEVRMAPWEITRVAGGLTLFATGGGRTPHPVLPEPAISELDGTTWFQYDRQQVKSDQKLFAHSNQGWLAHVTGSCVLIKEFEPVSLAQQAPGEAMIEIFASGLKDYIEIEQQGPFGPIAPGAQRGWQVNWFLRRLPPGLEARVGNSELVRWITTELGA